MKHIIITGGAGFIGSNFIDRLINDSNNRILCIDNLSTGNLRNIEQHLNNPNFYFLKAGIEFFLYGMTKELTDKITYFLNDQIDEIYNFACPASPDKYQRNPINTLETSIAIIFMCQLAKKYNAKILHTSTSEIYGEPEISPQPETYRGNVNTIGPRACYDEGKRVAETIMYEFFKTGVKCKMIRIFNTYGPKMDPNDGRVVSNFIIQCLKGKNITVYGTGLQTRSFQYIDDLLNGIEKVMSTDDDSFDVFNIGNPEEFTIIELANKIIEKIGNLNEIVFKDLPCDDPTNRKPDINKAIEKLSWYPKINLDSGLDKTIEYFKDVLY